MTAQRSRRSALAADAPDLAPTRREPGRGDGPSVLPGWAREGRRPALAPLLACVALAVVAYRYLDAVLRALDVFADYHAYYRAAANLRAGGDIYAEGRALVERNSYDYWLGTDGQYVYPPLLALLFLPLTVVDIGKGGTVWLLALVAATALFLWLATAVLGRPLRAGTVATILLPGLAGLPLLLGARYGLVDRFLLLLAVVPALACAAYAAARAFVRLRPFRLALDRPLREELALSLPVALPVLGAMPLLLSLRYGQVDLPLLLLTTLSLLAYLRGRDTLAGVALGLAAAVKPTLAFYGLFYLRQRRWTTLGAAAVTGLLLGLGPFLALGRAAFADWYAISRYFTGDDYPTYPSNQSWRGFLLRAFAGGPRHAPLVDAPWLAEALWVAGAAGALALWWRLAPGRAARDARDVAAYALTAAVMLFVAPLSEDVHYVALLFPLAVLAHRAVWGAASAWAAATAALACLYFAQPWLDFAYNRGGTDWQRLLSSGAYLYGLILVIAALIVALRTPPAAPPAG